MVGFSIVKAVQILGIQMSIAREQQPIQLITVLVSVTVSENAAVSRSSASPSCVELAIVAPSPWYEMKVVCKLETSGPFKDGASMSLFICKPRTMEEHVFVWIFRVVARLMARANEP